VARVAVERAGAVVAQREAEHERAVASLEKLVVRAPFDGLIVLKDAEVGEVVSPNSQGASSRGAVATLVDPTSLEVQVELPETNLERVEVGAAATLVLDAFPREPLPGRVDRIWPTANRQKATIEVRLAFDAPDPRLRPDMGVRVVFGEAQDPAQAATAPSGVQVVASALVTVDGAAGVFLFERGVVRFQPVEPGERSAATVQILAGLEPGQRVVAEPPFDLKDGDRVLAE
jgi:RND family efflux transporter MFP subunit